VDGRSTYLLIDIHSSLVLVSISFVCGWAHYLVLIPGVSMIDDQGLYHHDSLYDSRLIQTGRKE